MCTIFAIHTGDEICVGRNFDWFYQGCNVHLLPPTQAYGRETFGLAVIVQGSPDRPFEGINDQGLYGFSCGPKKA